MVEAYLFFFDQLKGFFLGEDDEAPLAAEHPIAIRVDECFQTLRSGLMVVVIDLQKDDDPQVIFETLNARENPSSRRPSTKLHILPGRAREKLDVEAVYKKYWSGFDDGQFWREEVSGARPESSSQRSIYAALHGEPPRPGYSYQAFIRRIPALG